MKLTPRKRHITNCASRSSRKPQTITPLLETHRHIYRLSGIQANLASILFDRRSDDTSAQLIINILTDVHALIEHLNTVKETLHEIAHDPIGPLKTKIAQRS